MMKKMLFILILLFFLVPNVNAQMIAKEDVNPRTYIIGKYMFTRNPDEQTGYDGKLTTKRIILASRTISGGQEDDMIVYYRKADGTWIEALTNDTITIPDYFDIEVIDVNGVVENNVSFENPLEFLEEDINPSTYIVGKYMFTRIPDNQTGYDGKLTTKRIMLAARSISETAEADMMIYYKNYAGAWKDALTGLDVTVPAEFEIINIDLIPQVRDTTAPVCTFGSISTINVGSTGTLDLTCLDYESGIATTTLSSNSFTLSNDKITIDSVVTSNVSNGKKYTLTLSANDSGTTTITLKNGAVKDLSDNLSNTPNTSVTSKNTYTLSFDGNGGTATTASVSCEVQNENSCTVTLPNNGFNYSDWTFNGWAATSDATSGDPANTSVTLYGNTTYYATWKKDVTVTFNANSCTTGNQVEVLTLYNGETGGTIIVPTATMLTGWESLGVSTTSSSTFQGTAMGEELSLTGIASNTTTLKRYYNCSKDLVRTLTYNANGGTGSIEPSSCTLKVYNGNSSGSCNVILKANTFTRDGFKFNGWGATAIATSGDLEGKSVTLTSDVTRYATWKEVSYVANIEYFESLPSSPDRLVTLYADGEKIEFDEVRNGNILYCTGDNPFLNVYELDGLTSLEILLKTGETITASIYYVELEILD